MRARIQKISKYAPSIFQGRFDFSQKIRRISLTIEHPVERITFRAFVCMLGVLASLYLYFVGTSVLNVVARKESLRETAALANAVSQLEREYLVASQDIGPEDGARLGLTPVSKTVYIHRPGNLSAGLPEQERSRSGGPAQAEDVAATLPSNEI
jgi:hypothetical protein